jgi:hypothetical protein
MQLVGGAGAVSEERVFRPHRRTLVLDAAAAAFLAVAAAFTALRPDASPVPRAVAGVLGVLVVVFLAMTMTRRVTVTPEHLEVRRIGSCQRFERDRVEVAFFRTLGGSGMTVTANGRTKTFPLTSFAFDEVLALDRATRSAPPERPTPEGNDPTRRQA